MGDEEGKDAQGLNPGYFSVSEEAMNQLDREEHKARFDTVRFIEQLKEKKIITPQYAQLLASIKSSTSDPDSSTLHKVQMVMKLKDKVADISDQHVIAYLGSGLDWQFPVSLGARNIEMVDIAYATDEFVSQLHRSVSEFDTSAEIHQDKINELHFRIDIGKGPEKVIIRLLPVSVDDYRPNHQLYGVLEHAGPSKGFIDETSPVLPEVARNISSGGFVLNADFNPKLLPSNSGLINTRIGDFNIFRVADSELFVRLAEKSYQRKLAFWKSVGPPPK